MDNKHAAPAVKKKVPAGKTTHASAGKSAAGHKAPVSRSRRAELARTRKKQQQRQLLYLAAAALAVVVLIIVLIRVSCSGCAKPDKTQNGSVSAAVTAPAPTFTPVPQYTPVPQLDKVELLPVYNDAVTTERVIAITIDDLNEVENLNKILDICAENGAKLTLFPIGQVIDSKPDLRFTLNRAYQAGHEIENHTYSHAKLYSLSADEMAAEIYRQNIAVNNALGLEYEMHFLRMPGGNGEFDARSHQYLRQLGTYHGVVNWGYSGSDASIGRIKNELAPGKIYLFHAKSDDLKKLREFIPYAVSQGYRLVTLNELFGLTPNRVSPLQGSANDYPIPSPSPYMYSEVEYVTLGNRKYTTLYAVQLLQKRLIELGYLTADTRIDGYYGDTSRAAVTLFQQVNGLEADGYAGAKTQKILFSGDARPNPGPAVTPMPSPVPTQAAESASN